MLLPESDENSEGFASLALLSVGILHKPWVALLFVVPRSEALFSFRNQELILRELCFSEQSDLEVKLEMKTG